MNIVIIDNDAEIHSSLSKLLRLFCTNINIIGISDSPKEGFEIIKRSDPDLVFLDSEIHIVDSFLSLKSPKKRFHTVLLAYGEMTLDKLGLLKSSTLGYLQKPIDAIALEKCVKDVRLQLKQQLYPEYNNLKKHKRVESERIGIPTSKGTLFIATDQIIYLKASNNYTEIIVEDGKPILVSKTLKSFERLLEGTFFMRVHQSYLVNLEKVIELQRVDGGALVLNNNYKIPISRANKQQIKSRLEESWKIV
jgi:two-component system LytT family response regulator